MKKSESENKKSETSSNLNGFVWYRARTKNIWLKKVKVRKKKVKRRLTSTALCNLYGFRHSTWVQLSLIENKESKSKELKNAIEKSESEHKKWNIVSPQRRCATYPDFAIQLGFPSWRSNELSPIALNWLWLAWFNINGCPSRTYFSSNKKWFDQGQRKLTIKCIKTLYNKTGKISPDKN